MKLTVRETLQFGGLKEAQVLAGADCLDRLVESISVLEVAESKISTWVVKNEMYITSFYAVKENVKVQKEVIHSLYTHGCCALVICHIGLLFDALDPSVIALCEELSLPLIVAKPEISYAQIIQPIFETLMLEEEGTETARHLKIRDDFLDLIINEQDIIEVFRKISHKVHCDISYYDLECSCIYSNKQEAEINEEITQIKDNFNQILDMCSKEQYIILPSKQNRRLVFLIRTRRNLLGFMVISFISEAEIPSLLEIADALNVVCSLCFSKQDKRMDIQEKYFQEFLGDLLVWNFRNDEVVLRKSREFGLELVGKKQIILININTLQQITNQAKSREVTAYIKKYIFPALTELLHFYNNKNEVIFRSDTIFALLEDPIADEALHQIGERIIELFERAGDLTVSIGVSEPFSQPSNISIAYNQAFQGAILGRRHYGENKIIAYLDVGFYRRLQDLTHEEEMVRISQKLLRPLLEYDEKYQSNLLETLTMLLRYNENTNIVASKMYVHRNTLLHRKNKIIEIYNYSPFEMPHLLNFLFATQILST